MEYDSIVNATEVQPSIRGIWTPDAKNTLWASVSRAARIPSPTELYCSPTEVRIPLPNHQPFDQDRIANPDLQVQHLIACEAGYRAEPIKSLSLDISTFYYASDHQYERVTLPNEIIGGQVVRPVRKTDDQNGQAWGFEIAPTWYVADNLSLSGSYSYLNMVQFGGISQLPYVQPDPRNQLKLQLHYDVTKQIGADSEFFWIDEFKSLKVPAYFRWDASVKWRPEKHVELSAGVWNIIDNGHPEQPSTVGTAYQVPRTFFVQLQVNF